MSSRINRVLNKLDKLMVSPMKSYKAAQSKVVLLRWSNSRETRRNFGDCLNPILFEKIFKYRAVHESKVINYKNKPTFIFIGSLLNNLRGDNLIICGAGFKSPSRIKSKPKEVLAVRGPLTRDVFISNNVNCPEVYCDPGIFVSDFFPRENQGKSYDVGIIPHYVDKSILSKTRVLNEDLSYKVLDIEDDIEKFLDGVASCKAIISSSLHGVITAHSYGIPAVWVRFSDKIIGGDFKFQDYYLSVGQESVSCVGVSEELNLKEVLKSSTLPDLRKNKKDFLESIREFLLRFNKEEN